MINRLYGILRGNCVIAEGTPGYRYSTCTASAQQLSLLQGLLSVDAGVRALQIDALIKLLKCSPLWPDFERKLDSTNTYDVPAVKISADMDFAAHKDNGAVASLLTWAKDKHTPNREPFIYSENDPELDVACAKLFNVIAIGA